MNEIPNRPIPRKPVIKPNQELKKEPLPPTDKPEFDVTSKQTVANEPENEIQTQPQTKQVEKTEQTVKDKPNSDKKLYYGLLATGVVASLIGIVAIILAIIL